MNGAGVLRKRQRLDTVTLLVTERCNLRCRYCYQMEQARQQSFVAMTTTDARAIAHAVTEKFAGIQQVQFFGGEPTLNLPAVEAFSDELRRRSSPPGSPRMPMLGMVTNGTASCLNDLLRCCRDNAIGVTVSIDGPREIHDYLRPSIGGKGSFERAMRTLQSLMNAGVPAAVETVVTAAHLDRGYSVATLLRYFSDLKVRKIVLHTAYPPAPATICPLGDGYIGRLIASFEEAVDWWFDVLLRGEAAPPDVYFADLLRPMLDGRRLNDPGTGCPAGLSNIAIGPTGDIYACHLLYGEPAYKLGNLLQDGADALQEVALPFATSDFRECQQCVASNWCQPCGALNQAWGDAWALPPGECKLRRAVIERLAHLAIAHLDVPRNPVTDVLWQSK